MSGQKVLWMCGVDHEGLSTSGQVVHWMQYQERHRHTYLGKKLLGCKVGWQVAVERVEAAVVGPGVMR